MIINQLELIINDYFAEILSNFFHTDSLILQMERSAEMHQLSNEISEDWRSLIQ